MFGQPLPNAHQQLISACDTSSTIQITFGEGSSAVESGEGSSLVWRRLQRSVEKAPKGKVLFEIRALPEISRKILVLGQNQEFPLCKAIFQHGLQ